MDNTTRPEHPNIDVDITQCRTAIARLERDLAALVAARTHQAEEADASRAALLRAQAEEETERLAKLRRDAESRALAEARLRQTTENRATNAVAARVQYDDEARALAKERTLIERQMVQEAEQRIKAEQALESIAIARQAEDEDAAFLARRRAELDAEVRRANEARLAAEREAAAAATARAEAEAHADDEAMQKADVMNALAKLPARNEGSLAGRHRLRLVMAGVLALLIGTGLGSWLTWQLPQLNPFTSGTASELRLQLDDKLGAPPP